MSKDTTVEFSGTKKREKGGQHAATQSAEKHDSPRAKGKRVQVPSSPSKCVTAAIDLHVGRQQGQRTPSDVKSAQRKLCVEPIITLAIR